MSSFGILHSARGAAAATATATTTASRTALLARRPVVAVVEDDAFMASMIAAELEQAGYHAVVFANGEALGPFVRLTQIAAIILDWELPEIDGAAVLQRLRTGGYSGPVIVFTGNSSVRFAAIANGATDCFEKSQTMAPVLACLRHSLESS